MEQRHFCPECGDYSSDREYPKTKDGYPDTPVCKSCGTKCTSLSDDPRMGELSILANRVGEARLEYQARINALENLTREVKKDWGNWTPEKND